MATVITEECINCGACEPECPNTAIYQGGVEFDDLAGAKGSAISNDFFYIVPEKCTECVGFFDEEACAAVCPVDCCIPDPQIPETEGLLIERAKQIHPDKSFEEGFPSRFSTGSGEADATATAPSTAGDPPAPAGAAAPVAAPANPAAGTIVAGPARIERLLQAPPRELAAGDPSGPFEGELSQSFDELVGEMVERKSSAASTFVGLVVLAASPLLGALGHKSKRAIEDAVDNRAFFASDLATGINVLLNFLLYPAVGFALGVASGKLIPFTETDRGWITMAILFAGLEAAYRLREGFRGVSVRDMNLGPACYGAPLGLLVGPIANSFIRGRVSGHVPVEGFYSGEFEEKRERQRRYGEVYRVDGFDGGYYVRFEMPRVVPASGAKEEMGIGDEMPDYEIQVSQESGGLIIQGSVVDDGLRALCGVSSSFPADFRSSISFEEPIRGFRHRYANKTLEIVALKKAA